MVRRAPAEPTKRDLFLGVRQLPGTSRTRLGGQRRPALATDLRYPSTHATAIDAKEVGNLLGRISIEHALHRQTTPMLQLRGGSFASHELQAAKAMPRTLLLSEAIASGPWRAGSVSDRRTRALAAPRAPLRRLRVAAKRYQFRLIVSSRFLSVLSRPTLMPGHRW